MSRVLRGPFTGRGRRRWTKRSSTWWPLTSDSFWSCWKLPDKVQGTTASRGACRYRPTPTFAGRCWCEARRRAATVRTVGACPARRPNHSRPLGTWRGSPTRLPLAEARTTPQGDPYGTGEPVGTGRDSGNSNAVRGGNPDLWACALTRHAFIGLYGDQCYEKTAPLVELARDVARRGDPQLSTRHWVPAVQAEVFAAIGDLDSCRRALDEAEEVHSLPGPVHNGGWLRFDGSRLAEERGSASRDPGAPIWPTMLSTRHSRTSQVAAGDGADIFDAIEKESERLTSRS